MSNKIGKDVIGGRRTTQRTQGRKKKASAERKLQKEIKAIADYLSQNPQEIDENTKEEMRKLIKIIQQSNPDFSEKASKLLSSIGTAADIAQLFTFLSGISSVPVLFQVLRIGNGLLNSSNMKSRRSLYRKKEPKIPKSVAYI